MNTELAPPPRTDAGVKTHWMAPESCGELIRGSLAGNEFLINCPIRSYAQATIETHDRPGIVVHDPARHEKVSQALTLLRPLLGRDMHHIVRLENHLHRGKRMASGAADLIVAMRAALEVAGVPLLTAELSELLSRVGPVAGTHITGLAQINHQTGFLYDQLPVPSGLNVLVVDCGSQTGSLSIDPDLATAVYRRNQHDIQKTLNHLTAGLKLDRNQMIADAATASTRLNQQIAFKPQLERLLRVTREAGALGVNCAHSGTMIGVLYENQQIAQHLEQVIAQAFGDAVDVLGNFPIISGGCIAY